MESLTCRICLGKPAKLDRATVIATDFREGLSWSSIFTLVTTFKIKGMKNTNAFYLPFRFYYLLFIDFSQ